MKVFLISLKRSQDRRQRVVPHLQSRNISFEIMDAVDGLQLSNEEMEKYCDMQAIQRHPHWLTRGTIGACLSHYKIYKKVVDENLDGACILEDDVVLTENFSEILKGLEPVMKENKFVLLYYTSWQQIDLKPTGRNLAPGFDLYEVNNLEGLNSAAGYVISREHCKTMMDFVLPIRNGADSWTEFSNKGAIPPVLHCVFPQPIQLAYAKSTIDYLQKGSLKSKISEFINDKKIFPFYQIFKIRRKMLINKMSHININKN